VKCFILIYMFMTTLLDRKKDRMSMASGLEVRVPFCDHRLVRVCLEHTVGYENVRRKGKRYLRQALKGVLPMMFIPQKSPYPKHTILL
jgi:asparagine synthase (glutamine-hydrolysing)